MFRLDSADYHDQVSSQVQCLPKPYDPTHTHLLITPHVWQIKVRTCMDTRSGLHRHETSIGSIMFPCPALRETGSVNSEQPPLSLDPHQFIFVPFAHRYEPCACHEQTTAAERCSGSYVCVYTQYMYVCIYSFVYV